MNPAALQAGNLSRPGHLLLTQLISTTTMCEQLISKLTHLCNSQAAPVPPAWDLCSACAPNLRNTNGSRDVTLRPRCTVPEVTGLTAPICVGMLPPVGSAPCSTPCSASRAGIHPQGSSTWLKPQRDFKGTSKGTPSPSVGTLLHWSLSMLFLHRGF